MTRADVTREAESSEDALMQALKTEEQATSQSMRAASTGREKQGTGLCSGASGGEAARPALQFQPDEAHA